MEVSKGRHRPETQGRAESPLRRGGSLVVVGVRVYLLLILSRFVITLFPLRRITTRLGRETHETVRDDLSEAEERYAYRVGAMIARLARFTPTNSNCYPQALTAWWLLSRRGIPTTYYYGARFRPDGDGLDAHVWVRSGNVIVTGGRAGPYRPLASYGADRVFLGRVAARRYRRSAQGPA
ncbi:MAG: lasso peptide biosynthesis B2 protein [Nitriliruptoraceae bacterium]|nr:lasso peptide biosynthesis B2 protein [Nitriliruptoraceae bacterium]